MIPTWQYRPIPCTVGLINAIMMRLGHALPKLSSHTLTSTEMQGRKPLCLTGRYKRPVRFSSSMESSGSINRSSKDFSIISSAKIMAVRKCSMKRGRVSKSVDLVGKFRWVREVIIDSLTRMKIWAISLWAVTDSPKRQCFSSVRKSLARLQRLAVPILLPALAKTPSPG